MLSIGVRVSDTRPDTSTAEMMTTANSWSRRPNTPGMKKTGRKTTASDSVIARMVKLTSFDPSSAASSALLPASMWRTMFSSITMASSTTKPTDRVSASSESVSIVYPSRYITANVPMIAIGRARLGMMVADTLRRKRKMTRMTRKTASSSVNWTSSTDRRIGTERSYSTERLIDGGTIE